MKTIGLIGGMSWESTVTYYRIVNEVVKEKLGGLHSAKCLLSSVDFQEIETCQAKGEWERSGELLADAAEGLQRAGADFFVICTNTMHKVAPQIASRVTIPLLHIADATADELLSRGVREAALLGTRYTMEQDFYKARLEAHGIHVRIPEGSDIALVNGVIFDELCQGIVSDASKAEYLRIIDSLSQKGAGGVILGCTEIGMLVSQKDTSVPLFDTTLIHARRAALYALGQG